MIIMKPEFCSIFLFFFAFFFGIFFLSVPVLLTWWGWAEAGARRHLSGGGVVIKNWWCGLDIDIWWPWFIMIYQIYHDFYRIYHDLPVVAILIYGIKGKQIRKWWGILNPEIRHAPFLDKPESPEWFFHVADFQLGQFQLEFQHQHHRYIIMSYISWASCTIPSPSQHSPWGEEVIGHTWVYSRIVGLCDLHRRHQRRGRFHGSGGRLCWDRPWENLGWNRQHGIWNWSAEEVCCKPLFSCVFPCYRHEDTEIWVKHPILKHPSLSNIPIILIYFFSSGFNSLADTLTPTIYQQKKHVRRSCNELASVTRWKSTWPVPALKWPLCHSATDGERFGERRRCWATAEFSFELLVSLCHDISWYNMIFWYRESNGDMS